jgi:hypothetical protein
MFEHANVIYFGNDRDPDGLPTPFYNFGIYAATDPGSRYGRAWIVCFSARSRGETGADPIAVPGGSAAAIAESLRRLDALARPAGRSCAGRPFEMADMIRVVSEVARDRGRGRRRRLRGETSRLGCGEGGIQGVSAQAHRVRAILAKSSNQSNMSGWGRPNAGLSTILVGCSDRAML